MSPCVKNLKLTYKPVNDRNTFTNGDWIAGQITFEVTKDCQIDSLFIKFKGKADVSWDERIGYTTYTYYAKQKYISFKQYFIKDKNIKGADNQTLLRNSKGELYSCVVAPGRHVYPFKFQIPAKNMPSSFKGSVGKIVYRLEARLQRSLWFDNKDSAIINFVSKPDLKRDSSLMKPQHDSKDKNTLFFSSGKVSMDVNIEKSGFFQGERMKVLISIHNNLSREIRPTYCVYRKRSFFASGKKKVDTKDLCEEVGDPIPPSTDKKVTRVMTIPQDLKPSILNCSIIKVEHRLRVSLDIKFALDPKVKFPIVILPGPPPPPPAAASGSGVKKPKSPAKRVVPTQPAAAPEPVDAPPPYGAHEMYPLLTGSDTKDQ